MSNTHLILPDAHAHYQHNNNRAIYLGELINDTNPTVVINLGDTFDLPSLSSYDKGQRSFQGRSYAADIAAGQDFHDKLWSTVRKRKRKLPRRICLIGNHEQRIERAINLQPELEGTIGYKDLDLEHWYDDVVYYEGSTPGAIMVDGICYAHFFISGVAGRPISGEHPAYSLLSKEFQSCTQGHTHVLDHCVRTRADGQKISGLVAGCFFDYDSDWAGEANKLYSRGVAIKRYVEDGHYDLQWISLKNLKKEYA